MTIADYIENIASAISSPPITYIEGKVWEANYALDNVSVFPVIYFRNFLTASYTFSKAGGLLYADYPISIEFLLQQDELDEQGSSIDDTIINTLTPLANEFIKRIYESDEYQNVAAQSDNQQFNLLYFRDRYDVIVGGIELNTTIRLLIDSTTCL